MRLGNFSCRLAPLNGKHEMRYWTAGAALAACLLAAPAPAATLRVALIGDAGTLDPHSQSVSTTTQLLRQIYEPLVNRGPQFQLEPGLAASWSIVEPTRWRFKLRPGVTFQDGQPLTSADVVFSLQRVTEKGSNYSNYVDSVVRVEAVDPLTVDVITSEPDPILVDKLTVIGIMSKAWCEANRAITPQNAAQQQESATARQTNGTGPFMLRSREPEVRTVLDRFPNWWGKTDGNVTEYVAIPIANNATRTAAFLSGQVDVLLDPPIQDIERIRERPNVKVLQGPETRTIAFVIDVGHDELADSDVRGKNPFRDLRVRQALYQAIDMDAITARILRGLATPAGLLVAPGVRGYDKSLDVRLPYDPGKAKALLKDAGYPSGFGFTFDCSNNRYPGDAEMCTAIAAMWARIGVRAQLNAMPVQTYFPKVQRRESNMFLLGTSPPTLDAYYSIQISLLSPGGRPGDGAWNLGGYKNQAIDDLAPKIRGELDEAKRIKLMQQAMLIARDDVATIPLFYNQIAWAVRSNIEVSLRADNQMEAKWVVVK